MSKRLVKGIKARRRGTKGAFGKAKHIRILEAKSKLNDGIKEIYQTLNQQN
jgi:hypothetical protein